MRLWFSAAFESVMLLYIGKALLLREKALNATLTQHLYIFFGTATLIGFSAGFILYLTSNYLDELLYLVPARSEDRQLGRRKRNEVNISASLGQVAKLQRRNADSLGSHHDHAAQQSTRPFSSMRKLDTYLADWTTKDRGGRPCDAGLFSTTIIEEVDSDFDGS